MRALLTILRGNLLFTGAILEIGLADHPRGGAGIIMPAFGSRTRRLVQRIQQVGRQLRRAGHGTGHLQPAGLVRPLLHAL